MWGPLLYSNKTDEFDHTEISKNSVRKLEDDYLQAHRKLANEKTFIYLFTYLKKNTTNYTAWLNCALQLYDHQNEI